MMTLNKRFSNIPYNLDVVNIGSGPSKYDFDWSVIPELTGYNFAIAPEDFRYDARIIKNYGNHLKKGGVVVVVVCPLSFGRNDYLERDSFSEKYVSILPAADVDLPKWKYALYKKFSGLLRVKNLFARLKRGVWCRISKLRKQEKSNAISPVQQLVNGWVLDNGLDNLTDDKQAQHHRDVFKEKEANLRKIIENCRCQGLRPVLVIPPMSDELRGYISDDFIKNFVYDNLRSVSEEGIPIFDYIDDLRFTEDSYYTNGLFLTPEMRQVFTKTVWADIGNLLEK